MANPNYSVEDPQPASRIWDLGLFVVVIVVQ